MNLLVALFVARTGNDSFEREFLVEDAVGMYASYVDGFHGRKESVAVIKSELEKLADHLLLDCSTRGDKQVKTSQYYEIIFFIVRFSIQVYQLNFGIKTMLEVKNLAEHATRELQQLKNRLHL
jgi:hypothetical protein